MRKAVLVPVFAALGVLLVLVGCAGTPGRTTTVPLGQAVSLSPGQSAEIVGENLRLTFLNVVTDSRCPTGAT